MEHKKQEFDPKQIGMVVTPCESERNRQQVATVTLNIGDFVKMNCTLAKFDTDKDGKAVEGGVYKLNLPQVKEYDPKTNEPKLLPNGKQAFSDAIPVRKDVREAITAIATEKYQEALRNEKANLLPATAEVKAGFLQPKPDENGNIVLHGKLNVNTIPIPITLFKTEKGFVNYKIDVEGKDKIIINPFKHDKFLQICTAQYNKVLGAMRAHGKKQAQEQEQAQAQEQAQSQPQPEQTQERDEQAISSSNTHREDITSENENPAEFYNPYYDSDKPYLNSDNIPFSRDELTAIVEDMKQKDDAQNPPEQAKEQKIPDFEMAR